MSSDLVHIYTSVYKYYSVRMYGSSVYVFKIINQGSVRRLTQPFACPYMYS